MLPGEGGLEGGAVGGGDLRVVGGRGEGLGGRRGNMGVWLGRDLMVVRRSWGEEMWGRARHLGVYKRASHLVVGWKAHGGQARHLQVGGWTGHLKIGWWTRHLGVVGRLRVHGRPGHLGIWWWAWHLGVIGSLGHIL